MTYTVQDKMIVANIKGNDFNTGLAFCKAKKFKFDYKTKLWTKTYSPDLESDMMAVGFTGFKPVQKKHKINTSADAPKQLTTEIPDYLYPFQREAVEFLLENDNKGMLVLDPGLGKTTLSVAWLSMFDHEKPLLIVCPSGLKIHWRRELKKFAKIKAKILGGQKPKPITNQYEVYIINYDVIHYWQVELKGKISGIILDESQYCTNPSAQRTKAVKNVQQGTSHKVFLSATPFSNAPIELFPQLEMLDKETWNYQDYVQRYCPMVQSFNGTMLPKGSANLEELHNRLKAGYMFRRRKEDVAPDLPEKNFIIHEIENNSKLLLDAEDELEDMIDSGDYDNAEIQEKIKELTRSAYFETKKVIHQFIDDYLATSDEKIVLVAYHKSVIEDLVKKYDAPYISGEVASHKRQGIIDRFETDKTQRVLVLQNIAGAEGFSILNSKTMFFVELYYSIAKHLQVQDRIHRIISKHDAVFYYYFILEDSILERMLDVMMKKSRVLTTVIDGKATKFTDDAKYEKLLLED